MRSTSQRDNETQQAENVIHRLAYGREEGNVSLRCDFIMQGMSEIKNIPSA